MENETLLTDTEDIQVLAKTYMMFKIGEYSLYFCRV